MRKLIYAINLTIDGYCDHTKFNPDEEVLDYFTQLTRGADTFVYGRKTYELMVPFWPDMAKNNSGSKADNEFAHAFDAVKKIVVFSRSLNKVEGKNTSLVHSNLEDEVQKLKQEEGKDILTGGIDLSSQLIKLGLVDEYRFVVHPILAAEGRRLLEGISLQEALQLKLVESRTFKAGCIALRYSKR